jgi:hypothetical protein
VGVHDLKYLGGEALVHVVHTDVCVVVGEVLAKVSKLFSDSFIIGLAIHMNSPLMLFGWLSSLIDVKDWYIMISYPWGNISSIDETWVICEEQIEIVGFPCAVFLYLAEAVVIGDVNELV